ncbi:hypothetical protein D1007_36029 [Hordeum vulgare]|nr:hypothetical protein D1007_36029 [Hordeum vulgare]
MAFVQEIPRQLALGVGTAATTARVTFRAGPFTPFGERAVHGLLVRYDALDCVNDNALRLEDTNFPVDGYIIAFGSHRVYVTVLTDTYPA